MWDGIERRRYMPNGFKPQTAFEGYVVAKMEAMSDRLDTLPCKSDEDRIVELEKKVSNIEGKATLFGAITGFIAGLISRIFLGK